MKKVYQTPTLKVVEFKVERGFLGSMTQSQQTSQLEMNYDEEPRVSQFTRSAETFQWN